MTIILLYSPRTIISIPLAIPGCSTPTTRSIYPNPLEFCVCVCVCCFRATHIHIVCIMNILSARSRCLFSFLTTSNLSQFYFRSRPSFLAHFSGLSCSDHLTPASHRTHSEPKLRSYEGIATIQAESIASAIIYLQMAFKPVMKIT